ncbi:MAG: 5-oxoprolinase [Legionellales bacterium]|nr:5-oxoprolinase [Legionellales bacterium]
MVSKWQFWIDVGGTFTDVIAITPQGQWRTHKLLSNQPQQYRNSAIQGIYDVLSVSTEQSLDTQKIESVHLGSTVATNALLERKGARTALITTRGFKDGLTIGYQNRPDIFALQIKSATPLMETVLEVDERIRADGQVLQVPDVQRVMQDLRHLWDQGIQALAIVFMHGYRFFQHEQIIRQCAQQVGFQWISVSHEVSPLIKWVPRAMTTVVNAYLSPLLADYVNEVQQAIEPAKVYLMQSNGGLVEQTFFQAKDAILSGPAGGVIGMAAIGKTLGLSRLVGFDMGGTSTDVCHYQHALERCDECVIAGVPLAIPMLAIDTVAAGGGSICGYHARSLTVGPESAGADPGPACYGRGGPLTITDCHLLLGHLQVASFPKVFGVQGRQPLDVSAAKQKMQQLIDHIEQQSGERYTQTQLANGLLALATETMAQAIQQISLARGHDVRDHALMSFGGAAGQHACAIAQRLGIDTVVNHPLASVQSAVGIGMAHLAQTQQQTILLPWNERSQPRIQQAFIHLQQKNIQQLQMQGAFKNAIVHEQTCYLAYQKIEQVISVAWDENWKKMRQQFEQTFQTLFGYLPQQTPIECRKIEVVSMTQLSQPTFPAWEKRTQPASSIATSTLYDDNQCYRVPVYQRKDLSEGQSIIGPAIVTDAQTCLLVLAHWVVHVRTQGALVLQYQPQQQQKQYQDTLMQRALFGFQLMAIAEQMGVQLRKTALSVNIKERLDYSCAIFTKRGELIANAPHIPIHLGSMGATVQAIIAQHFAKASQALCQNDDQHDAYIVNSPYLGGTHLPDITLVSPVYVQGQLAFFVASRAHHADVGGLTPGSFPADSHCIQQEGILLNGELILQQGTLLLPKLIKQLEQSPYPVRNIKQNIADIQAQIAANQRGIQLLQQLTRQYGLSVTYQQIAQVLEQGAACVRDALKQLTSGRATLTLDNGAIIQVVIEVDQQQQQATIDFSGSSAQQTDNYNAPYAVTRACVLYVFRTLVQQTIPLNDGCFQPLKLIIPAGSLLDAQFPAAVVAGNVETSQCIVDALYQALGVLAGSQGTMNNLLFGNEQVQYYETLAGGAGAGNGFDGASAVHTHMTNSRLTDHEILEWYYPIFIEQFSIRYGSGGVGRWSGGDGVIRRLKFQQPMIVSLLTNHRLTQPAGIEGGAPGWAGCNWLIRASGEKTLLDFAACVTVAENDVIMLETPGGGGFGKPIKETE